MVNWAKGAQMKLLLHFRAKLLLTKKCGCFLPSRNIRSLSQRMELHGVGVSCSSLSGSAVIVVAVVVVVDVV